MTKISFRQLPCSVHQLMSSTNLLLNLFSSWWSGIRSSGLCQRTGGRVNKHCINIFGVRDKFELGSKFDFIYLSYAADILKLKYSGATEMKKRSKLAKLPRPSFAQFIDYLLRTDVMLFHYLKSSLMYVCSGEKLQHTLAALLASLQPLQTQV